MWAGWLAAALAEEERGGGGLPPPPLPKLAAVEASALTFVAVALGQPRASLEFGFTIAVPRDCLEARGAPAEATPRSFRGARGRANESRHHGRSPGNRYDAFFSLTTQPRPTETRRMAQEGVKAEGPVLVGLSLPNRTFGGRGWECCDAATCRSLVLAASCAFRRSSVLLAAYPGPSSLSSSPRARTSLLTPTAIICRPVISLLRSTLSSNTCAFTMMPALGSPSGAS